MPNCLGIYAENNIIKYAKLNTDKTGGALRLASYGVRFSENTRETIEDIIKETNSQEDNIATNIVNERYESIQVFSRLSKKDTKGIVESEFANICDTKGLLPSILEIRTSRWRSLPYRRRSGRKKRKRCSVICDVKQ